MSGAPDWEAVNRERDRQDEEAREIREREAEWSADALRESALVNDTRNPSALAEAVRWLAAEVRELPRKPPPAVMPSARPRVLVEVFSQPGEHDPFIRGADGHITAEMIDEIERDLREGYEDICASGAGSYLFEVRHQEGQYGDEGRCEIPPHFELTLVAFERPGRRGDV